MSFLKKFFGDASQKTIKTLQPLVAQINGLEADIQKLTDDALQEKMRGFRTELNGKPWSEQKEILEKFLPEVFAITREIARRKLGQRHYDVQLVGGMVLHQGKSVK